MSEIAYNVAIEGDFAPLLIDWGNEAQWIDRCRAELDSAARLSLIPKDGQKLPVVSVQLGNGRRWVLFSRIVSRVGGKSVRLYAIGWQQTINGINVKSLTWVYPNGTIENGENPTYAELFLAQSNA